MRKYIAHFNNYLEYFLAGLITACEKKWFTSSLILRFQDTITRGNSTKVMGLITTVNKRDTCNETP